MLRSAAAYSSRHKSFLFLSNEILFVKLNGDAYKDDESKVTKPAVYLLGDRKKIYDGRPVLPKVRSASTAVLCTNNADRPKKY